MGVPLQVKQVTVDTVSWTALTVPFACDNVTVVNPSTTANLKVRTDPTDSATEVTLQPLDQFPVLSPRSRRDLVPYGSRFESGTTVVSAQASAGTGPAVLLVAA